MVTHRKRLLIIQDPSNVYKENEGDRLKLYNTLTGRKEEFQPREPRSVKMFVCGPTVYDRAHIGHARTYLIYDTLARCLKAKGFRIRFIVNITDLDDKVFEKAREEGLDFRTLAERYTREFIEDMRSLRINSVDAFIKASAYLEEIERQIEQLIRDGYAYQIDGDIYFDTSTFPEYGKLSHLTSAEIKLRRLHLDPRKRDQSDFPLWRGWGEEDPPPSFPSRFGRGRPGWHIEDTAISISNLGSGYDIHGGAVELIFPHHEAEIAQAESLTGHRPFVKYWVHTGLLVVDKEKMSKSLGNVVVLRDTLERCDPDALRLYLLSRHYRKTFDFRMSDIKGFEAKTVFLRDAFTHLKERVTGSGGNPSRTVVGGRLQRYVDRFFQALDDDLDTPKAIDALTKLLDAVEKDEVDDLTLLERVRTMLSILGLEPDRGG